MDSRRLWVLIRITLILAGIITLFLSGIAPFEEYFSYLSPQTQSAAVVAADVATLTNQNREQQGLPALSVNPVLNAAAQLKADDMARNSYYAHISPDGKSPLYWLQQVGYKYLNAGENLVIDRDTSEDAVDAWMHSAAHRENILRPQFTEIGIGVAPGRYKGEDTIYVVQEFGTPYPLAAPKLSIIPKKILELVTQKKSTPAPLVAEVTQKQTSASSTTAVEETPVKTALGVSPLPPTSIMTEVNVVAAPIIHALTPAIKKAVAPQTARRPATTTPSSKHVAVGDRATSTIATSSFAYSLPPEFFAPVSYAPLAKGSTTIQRQHEETRLSSTGPALTAPQIERPKVLSAFIPGVKATFGHISASLRMLWRY